jgi:predicted MPP superfamily phosphohydrolase
LDRKITGKEHRIMTLIYVLVSLTVLGLIYMLFEASWLEVNHIRFSSSEKGLKLLHISDIHINLIRVKNSSIRRRIDHIKPDLILLSGDYIEKPKDIVKFHKFLKEVCYQYSTYIVFGNHDYKAFMNRSQVLDEDKLESFKQSIEKLGVKILHNSSIQHRKGSKTYNIVGLEDLSSKNTDVKKALSCCSTNASMTLAFCHNPDIVLKLSPDKVDYCLAGHFHGGQIWLPFNLEYKLLRHDKLCKMGYHKGRHKVNGINIYINRGIGNVCFPLRFLSRPEMAVIYFE